MAEKQKLEFSEGLFSFMTTEHFTLQSARGIINGEIASRVSLYFTTLSSILIAAAFLAQLPDNGEVLFLFVIIAFPIILFIGLLTFTRMIQLGVIDSAYIRAINRIRNFYVHAAPEASQHLLFPPYDDPISVGKYGGYQFSRVGNLLSITSIVAMINSVLLIILFGLVALISFDMTVWQYIPFSLLVLVLVVALQRFLALRVAYGNLPDEYHQVLFPDLSAEQSQPVGEHSHEPH